MNTTEILLKDHGEKLNKIIGLMSQQFLEIGARFEKMGQKFTEIEDRFDKMDRRFVELEDKMLARFDFLEGKIIGVEDKVGSLEKRTEMGFLGIQNQLDNIAINYVPVRARMLLEGRVKKIERK